MPISHRRHLTYLAITLIAAITLSCNNSEESTTDTTTPTAPEGVTVPDGMVYIPGGTYQQGNAEDPGNLKVMLEGVRDPAERKRLTDLHFIEERPVHTAKVKPFLMDATEVTNAEFAAFVEATGYVTLAERGLDAKDFPNASPEDLVGGANVFVTPEQPVNPRSAGSAWRWWSFTPGANWRHPQGPDSTIEDKMDHPVTCINYHDAVAYAEWAGKRLPTEAEWEFAARGGHQGRMFIWGDTIQQDGEWMTNCFQGNFPNEVKADDGFKLTAPVKSYPANDYGLYDMAGNVWEICSDYFDPSYYTQFKDQVADNPQGPDTPLTARESDQYQATGTCPPPEPGTHPLTHLRVSRGGSFLCHYSYCLRFRPAARHYHEPLTPTHHTGFRCVKDIAPTP